MENKLRNLYDTFLDSGELKEVLPEATGIWAEDELTFVAIYSNLDNSIEHFEDDEDEEDSVFVDDEYYF